MQFGISYKWDLLVVLRRRTLLFGYSFVRFVVVLEEMHLQFDETYSSHNKYMQVHT